MPNNRRLTLSFSQSAAQTHVDNSFGNSFEFTENNIRGTHVLLETIKTLGTIKRFLHVSTDEVYGESSYENNEANVESLSLLEPTNPYSATKAGAEMLVMAYGRSYNLPYVITRGNNVYGPHQYPEKAIPKFIMLARNGMKIPIHGDGLATRSYMHVSDAASAFDAILHKGETKGVYNIGAHEERTVLSVAEDIGKSLGKDISKTVTHVTDRKFNDRRYFIDCSKLLALGWTQQVSWEDGLKETIEWYTKNDDQSGYWGNLSGALVAHPTGGKPNLVGEVYQNLEDMMVSISHPARPPLRLPILVPEGTVITSDCLRNTHYERLTLFFLQSGRGRSGEETNFGDGGGDDARVSGVRPHRLDRGQAREASHGTRPQVELRPRAA